MQMLDRFIKTQLNQASNKNLSMKKEDLFNEMPQIVEAAQEDDEESKSILEDKTLNSTPVNNILLIEASNL